jgi:oligoendopeptidase F
MSEEKLLPKRDEIPEEDRWDLSYLFKGENEWEELFQDLEKNIENYKKYKGKLKESIAIFVEAIEFDLQISRELEQLHTFAHLKSDEDKTNQHHLGLYQRSMNLANRAAELSSFMTPEIQSIPDEIISTYLQDEKLREYGFYLEKILRFKPHTLKEESEEILAMSGEIAHAPSQFFSQLDNADLKFGTIRDETGDITELSHGNFVTFLMNPNREMREKAFFQYYQAYEDHKHSIATSLAYSTKKDFFYSRVRNFKDCRNAALFPDNVPEKVYDNLVETVKNNLAPLFKYLTFRREVLNLGDLHFYDTYVPLINDIRFHMPYKEAVAVCAASLKPLGEEYTKTLLDGMLGGWVDRYENRGKRSGAYSSGCFDSPPYILLNYRDDTINSLYTLIHEAGHSMHSYYSNKSQPYVYHDYTIFVAEVASTFNEALLSSYLLDHYRDDKKMQAYILNREIDNIRGTLFRQTMFAEFEKIIHGIIEENNPLTLDTITDIYRELLQAYFSDTVIIDEALTLECLRIPHFYSAFYVYKYSTGISAALALADKVLSEDESAQAAYLNFLKMGGSRYPLEELREAGIDMEKPEPIENAIKHFEELVDRLIIIYNNI